ncbi:MAG: carboxypeptidase regulatory-like domain-containing protein [Actinobacteria bacterium]|nr:carboxypeptidase regulatory-like domain-containing protein [Actinomycetota bacterium]
MRRAVAGPVAALMAVAGVLAGGPARGQDAAFDCPDLGGTELFAGGEITVSGSEWHFFCTYSKVDYDAGQVAVTWFEPGSSPPECPLAATFETDDGYNARGAIGSASHAAHVSYRYHTSPPGDLPREAIVGLAGRLLAAAEARAVACGTASPGTASPSPSPSPDVAVCEVGGLVTDSLGRPVANVLVQLNGPGLQAETATDGEGRYRFSGFVPPGSAFDPATDLVTVSLLLQEGGPRPRFRFLYRQVPGAGPVDAVAEARTAPFAPVGESCVKDPVIGRDATVATPSSADDWRDLWAMYRQLSTAIAFAEGTLGARLDHGLPLSVVTWCDSGVDELCDGTLGAFYSSNSGAPYIGLEVSESAGKGLVADDTIYHEFGHALMVDVNDDRDPSPPGRVPHGGYYGNPYSSNDSWIEGFATFFSTMVAKHVEGRPPRFRFRSGAEQDLEADLDVWSAGGRYEELAVASLLLDFEDGPGDYAAAGPADVPVDDVRFVDLGGLVVGEVRGLPGSSLARLFVRFLGESGDVLATRSVWIAPGEDRLGVGGAAQFMVPVPEGIGYSTIRITGLRDAAVDDDPIDLSVEELWSALEDGSTADPKAGKPDDYGHIFDVAELHDVLMDRFGGLDRDGDGTEDVDQVFIAHGFYDDPGGIRRYEPGAEVGPTGHPPVGPDGRPAGPPTIRYGPPVLPELEATVEAHGVEVSVVAFVDHPAPGEGRGYAYEAVPVDGRVPVLVPDPGTGATVTLVAAAPGYLPRVIGVVGSEEFWARAAERPGTPYLAFDALLEPGTVELGGSSGPWGILLVVSGALVVLGVLALVPHLVRRRRAGVGGRT